MKFPIIKLFAVLMAAILFCAPALAQTPDGETPATESVCDKLKIDDVTQGLYGLCIAFCQAQDHASELLTITEEELSALADAVPSGKILESYNRMKTNGDPEMPCIKVEEPCPCWSDQELAELDGVMWDGTPAYSTLPSEPDGTNCRDGESSFSISVRTYEVQRSPDSIAYTTALVFDTKRDNRDYCLFRRELNGPDGTSTYFIAPLLGEEDLARCFASLRDFQANSGFCRTID